MGVAYSGLTRARRVVLSVFIAFALPGCSGAETPPSAEQASEISPLTIDTAGGVQHFSVEVVETPEAQSRGLMYRTHLAPDAGMLFPFGDDAPRSFWMKNTILPLDMIFIRSTGEIVAIAENTVPYSLRPISPRALASAVLELNAGTAQRLGIRLGDHVHHPAITGESSGR